MNARNRRFCQVILFVILSFGIPYFSAAEQLTIKVSGSGNDAYALRDTSQITDLDSLHIGDYSSGPPPYYRAALRFTSVTIPQGATISSAYIKIHSRWNYNPEWMYLDINGEDVDNSTSFDILQTPIGQRTLTSETAYWDFNDAWSQNSAYTSPDIGNVVQEIVSRSGWSSGNALTLFLSCHIDDSDDRYIWSYDGSSSYAAEIVIYYEEATYSNLKPYHPPEWDDIIVVSTVPGTHTDASNFDVNQTLYIDVAWINAGYQDAGTFRTSLYIDGVERDYDDGSLPAGFWAGIDDSEWTFTTVGLHTLRIEVDTNDDIDEGSNEGDNEFERQIYVGVESDEDPLYPDQWHLNNTGQGGGTAGEDSNVESVWDKYRGSHNEIIAIVDDGLQIAHEDLAPNVIPGMSIDYNVGEPDDDDPTPSHDDDNHGTAVAGVAGARGWNGIGVRGVAPEAGLVGYKIFEGDLVYDADLADAWSRNSDTVSIYNSSFGSESDILGEYTVEQMNAIQDGVENGRGGLGCIYVQSAGNGGANSNGNYNGVRNLRYVVSVGATDNHGDLSSYSTPGANVRVNAPSSGETLWIATTDRTGTDGYNNGDYTTTGEDEFGGTSSAAPLVSGVVALMLQANPNLTWRDVQMILMETAEKNDPSDSGWGVNGEGHDIHYSFGFGRVDAQAAVDAAETWATLPAEDSVLTAVRTPDSAIPDNNATGISDSIEVESALNIEFVEVYFSASDHPYWGDLEIVLTSPSGIESVLAEQHGIGPGGVVYDGYENWRFGTVRHLDESSQGIWTLTVRDLADRDTGTFENWHLRIFGTPIDKDNDGLSDNEEIQIYGTEPDNPDTDCDGLNDGIEVTYWGADWDADPDGDLLVNLLDPDSDNDGLNDGLEVHSLGTDPTLADTNSDGIHDGDEDSDGDGFTNIEEIECGSDPADANSRCKRGLPWLMLLLE